MPPPPRSRLQTARRDRVCQSRGRVRQRDGRAAPLRLPPTRSEACRAAREEYRNPIFVVLLRLHCQVRCASEFDVQVSCQIRNSVTIDLTLRCESASGGPNALAGADPYTHYTTSQRSANVNIIARLRMGYARSNAARVWILRADCRRSMP